MINKEIKKEITEEVKKQLLIEKLTEKLEFNEKTLKKEEECCTELKEILQSASFYDKFVSEVMLWKNEVGKKFFKLLNKKKDFVSSLEKRSEINDEIKCLIFSAIKKYLTTCFIYNDHYNDICAYLDEGVFRDTRYYDSIDSERICGIETVIEEIKKNLVKDFKAHEAGINELREKIINLRK